MKSRKRDDWDDDWDDDVVKKKPQKGPGLLNTRRILWGLAAIVVAAILIGQVVSPGQYDFKETPPALLGMWTCNDPERSDFWVDFRPEFVIFGTGGTSTVKHRIVGFNVEQLGGFDRYKVYYRDMAGREHEKEALVAESGVILRFADDPATEWGRYK